MSPRIVSLEQTISGISTEQDWLFEKLLGKLNSLRHLLLIADPGWGIQVYIKELGFQLAEKNPDFHTCFMDIRPVHNANDFLEFFELAIRSRFPQETSSLVMDKGRMDTFKLPELIARKHKIKIAVFLENTHLFRRFTDPLPFLREMKLRIKNQKSCVYCFSGTNSTFLKDLVYYPGPLSGVGQLYEFRQNQLKYGSASIRKLFHDHNKMIGNTTAFYISHLMDDHPFYIRLLAWHVLLLTERVCTDSVVERSLDNLILHFDYQFRKQIEGLTLKQLNFLRALVDGNRKLYASATREEYQLGSSSNIARIKTSLEKKDIIRSDRSGTYFTVPVFREWLRRCYF